MQNKDKEEFEKKFDRKFGVCIGLWTYDSIGHKIQWGRGNLEPELKDFFWNWHDQKMKELEQMVREEIIKRIRKSLPGACLINNDTLMVRADIEELLDELSTSQEEKEKNV